jgi:hypothetical protein
VVGFGSEYVADHGDGMSPSNALESTDVDATSVAPVGTAAEQAAALAARVPVAATRLTAITAETARIRFTGNS